MLKFFNNYHSIDNSKTLVLNLPIFFTQDDYLGGNEIAIEKIEKTIRKVLSENPKTTCPLLLGR